MTQDTIVAVITGAGSGMGRASSLKLAAMGMNVVLVDYNLNGAEETLSLIRGQGGDGIAVQADVSKADQVEAYVKQAMDQYGRIDVFFNNAGVIQKPFLFADISEEEFDRVVAVNFKGVFLGMKYVLKVMEVQGFGTIINTASTAGLKPEHSVAAYSATKHAVVSLTKSAALGMPQRYSHQRHLPGRRQHQPGGRLPGDDQDDRQCTGDLLPRMGRMADPAEIANVVAFLASEGASYMTGSIVAIDGGLTL